MGTNLGKGSKEGAAFLVFDGPRDLRIEVPSRMKTSLLLMNAFGLLTTCFSFGISASRPTDGDISPARLLFTVLGTLVLVLTVWGTLYMLAGKTVITLDGMALRISRGLFGIGWSSAHAFGDISNLRHTDNIDQELVNAGKRVRWQFYLGSSNVQKDTNEPKPNEGAVFDDDGHPRWLAQGLRQGDAQALIVEILHRFPELARKQTREPIGAAG